MGMFRRWGWVIAVVMVALFPQATLWAQTPRNVILFIGDGMGSNQITATRIDRVGQAGRLVFDLFRYVGLMTTHAADKLVTDSAAAGTSLASGVKTDNGMIGQLPDGTAVVTIAELAKRHGKRVGIVTDVPVTHATPASFLAHHPKRSEQDRIAEQIVIGGMDLVMGGGLQYFLPRVCRGASARTTGTCGRKPGARDSGISNRWGPGPLTAKGECCA